MSRKPHRCLIHNRVLVGGLAAWFSVCCWCGCRGQPKPQNGVQFTDLGGYLEFVARQRTRDQESKRRTGDSRSEETIFEENFKLETEGYVYHPNFLEFTLGGLFGLLQHDFEDEFGGRRRTSGDDGTIVEFDASGHFLKKKKYPGTIFGRRYRSLEPRPFQSSLEVTTTNYGLVWQYVDEKMPTTLQFSHTDVRLDPLDGREQDGRQVNTQFRLESEYHINEQNVLSLTYSHESVEEEPFELDYTTDEVTLEHRLDFGDARQHRLESEVQYFDQRGTFDVRRSRWRETLRLQHSENLRSWYQFEALDRTQGNLAGVEPIEEESLFFSGTVEHKLYESLVSQLYGFAQTQEFGSGLQIDRYGVQASLDYRKKNLWGVLMANYRARFQQEDRDGTVQSVAVTDERHTFRDPEPVVLSNTDILVGSIFITGEDRVTLFQRGRDYTVLPFSNRVEIRRVPTGRIEDGETVLIDYVFTLGGDFSLDTINQDFNIRQKFSFGLSPYYRLRWQDQSLSPREATGATPEDITAHIFGVEFERKSFRLKLEFEDHDSTINPFEALRLTADYTYRFRWGATGIVKARWSDISQDLPNERDIRLFTIEGRYRHPVDEYLTLEGMVLYRNEEDSLSGDDTGIDVEFSLEWSIRQTDVLITYEFGRFEDDFTRNNASALFVQVRRTF